MTWLCTVATQYCVHNAYTIALPKETTSLLRPLSIVSTMLTLLTSLKRPPLCWGHSVPCPQCSHYWPPYRDHLSVGATQYCVHNAHIEPPKAEATQYCFHTIDLRKETTSLLGPLSTVSTMLTLLNPLKPFSVEATRYCVHNYWPP